MRGSDGYNESLFSTVRPEDFVPATHPLRPIRMWTNEALARMHERFSAMCEADVKGGRPSIAPERLVRAMLLQVLYSVRSERQLVEQISHNLLFRGFVGLSIEDAVWNHSVFSKNRERMIEHEVVIELFNAAVNMARAKDLRLGEQAPALLSFLGHIATDNRHALVVNVETTKATGTAERDAAAAMLGEIEVRGQHVTVGADKAYDTRGFVRACREIDVTPHVAQNVTRRGGSAIDGRTTRHVGYANSQRKRKRTEQCFGWAKTVGPMCQVMLRGLDKVNHAFTLTMVAYNLTRLRNLADSAASRIRQERQTHRLPQCKDAMSSPVQVSTFDSTGGHCMTRPVLATVTRSAVQSSVFQRPDKPQGPLINLRNLFR